MISFRFVKDMSSIRSFGNRSHDFECTRGSSDLRIEQPDQFIELVIPVTRERRVLNSMNICVRWVLSRQVLLGKEKDGGFGYSCGFFQ